MTVVRRPTSNELPPVESRPPLVPARLPFAAHAMNAFLRPFLVRLHRWFGLAIALFLFVAGLTGALIAWDHELDAALNPDFYIARSGAAPLAPLELAARIEAADPRVQVTYLPLAVEPGHTLQAGVMPRTDPATGQPYALGFSQIAVDPATGAVQGRREWGALSLARLDLMPFIYRLHYSLFLPVYGGINFGFWVMGVVGIVWAIDSLIALVLAFPNLKSWRKSFAFRVRRGGYPLVFDLHRSGGGRVGVGAAARRRGHVDFDEPCRSGRAPVGLADVAARGDAVHQSRAFPAGPGWQPGAPARADRRDRPLGRPRRGDHRVAGCAAVRPADERLCGRVLHAGQRPWRRRARQCVAVLECGDRQTGRGAGAGPRFGWRPVHAGAVSTALGADRRCRGTCRRERARHRDRDAERNGRLHLGEEAQRTRAGRAEHAAGRAGVVVARRAVRAGRQAPSPAH